MLNSHCLPSIRRFTVAMLLLFGLMQVSQWALPAQLLAQAAHPGRTPILTLRSSDHPERDAGLPSNTHNFGEVRSGQSGEVHTLTLGFTQNATLTSLRTTPDFRLFVTEEGGGACAEGNHYGPESSCTVRVLFTPRGPGKRVGKLIVKHTASARPESIGLTGANYAPSISFVPAMITTVPSTYSTATKQGLIVFPAPLAVDGGDNLYIGDAGKGEIDEIDSSGNFTVFAGGGTVSPGDGLLANQVRLNDPSGITTDINGNVYLVDYEFGLLDMVDIDQYLHVLAGDGDTCNMLPCTANSFSLVGATGVALNPSGGIYVADFSQDDTLHLSDNVLSFYAADPEQQDGPVGLTNDAYGNLYYSTFEYCQVRSINAATQAISIVAGTPRCGYSGDGGQARGAELNGPRQVSFDAAGDLYLVDHANQVIRRVDVSTGLIHTIAGTGLKAGYSGDGGPATSALLGYPQGVAVDSAGNVYVADTSNEVVRKIGPLGNLDFSSPVAVKTAVQTITVTNTGNAGLQVAQVYWSGTNPTNFATDTHTTTCSFLPSGSGYLSVGQSCTIGFTFTPSGAGSESAFLNLVSNTNATTNTIQLNGTGLKLTPTITWPAPASITTTTALSSTQLDAKATYNGAAVAGTFVYTPASGAKLPAGTQTLKTTFTPASATLYNDASASVSIKVTTAATRPTVTIASNKNPGKAMKPITFAVTLAGAEGNAPTGRIEFFSGSTRIGAAGIANGKATLTVDSLAAGTHPILAVYEGDDHYASSTSSALMQKVTN